MVGADRGQVQGSGTGAAYIFTKSGNTWNQTAKLTEGSDASPIGDQFGYSVALDGDTAVVGAQSAYVLIGNGYKSKGAVYIFARSNGNWSRVARFAPRDEFNPKGDNQDLGRSVAMFGNAVFGGDTVARVNGHDAQGAVFEYQKASDGSWSQTQTIVASNGDDKRDYFGQSLATDGPTLLVGATGVDNHVARFGAAYFESQADLGLALSAPGSVHAGANYVSQAIATNNASAASPAVALTLAVPAAASFVSASATQGSCSEKKGMVTCVVGQIDGNAGTAKANVTLKAPASGSVLNTASIARATPAITASARTVISNNAAPVAKDGTLTTDENQAAHGTLEASDPDGDALTFSIVSKPKHGQVKIDDKTSGAYTYTPAKDYTGKDSFTFKANDGTTDSNTAAINITVKAAANHPPVAKDGTLTTDENQAASGKLKASDPDGDALSFSIVAQPKHGSVTLNDASTGAYTYTPAKDYAGKDSFSFKANDGTANSNTATISITVKAAANQPPVASDGTLATNQDTAATGTLKASDPDGDALTFSIVSQPSNGSVTLDDASTGAYTYTPNDGYSGSDSFTFKASDGKADSNIAKVSVTVKASKPNPPNKGGGGGGAFGELGLLALLGLALAGALTRGRRR